ncbi:tripartite tricarboxylate transporter permease [Poseidonocella sp. HB161398]|uniref:tripartite tricarboxylate transporter permease n=1 Tax=Poseidonocella sp. HB161398 TaxID=2320855 RepID=UPI001109FF92|nr:tripartite tricarboxylate transporter permease [Poseidonocella sp. HB161398]
MAELLAAGFGAVFAPHVLILIILGTSVGIVFGAVPGLTAVMAIALTLPMTYSLGPVAGMALLMSLFIGATSGGLISAILLKIPGTPSSIATTFDGIPMMERGEGAKALGVGVVFSFIGTILSIAVLAVVAPWLAKVALRFGPQEYFAIAVFSLTLIATLSSGNLVKGVFAGTLGVAVSTVGIAPVEAARRFTFGMPELNSGFQTLTVLIGMFAISEVLSAARSARGMREPEAGRVELAGIRGFGFSLAEFRSQIPNALRSSAVGIGVGILPGVGSGTSNILSYIFARSRSKHPETFGTGVIDGVVASETANNAGIGGAMVPLLTLGIPGDAVTAILLGGLMVHGVQPGPLLFVTQSELVYAIFAAMTVSSVVMLLVEFFGIRIFVRLLAIPKHILLPVILVLCVIGAFGLSSRMFDAWTILVFGLLGYGFSKGGVPVAPFIIGFILGPMAETNLRRGLMLSDGNFLAFFANPIALAFLLMAVASLGWQLWRSLRGGGGAAMAGADT